MTNHQGPMINLRMKLMANELINKSWDLESTGRLNHEPLNYQLLSNLPMNN